MPIQIRFSDLDALNHVNNSYHSQYFDVGRINYFEAVMGSKVDWSKIMVVIVHIEIDILEPIIQGDKINVETVANNSTVWSPSARAASNSLPDSGFIASSQLSG